MCVIDLQLEKLQAENAQEWAQREKLSSEKIALERENKRLKSEISRLEEELSRQSRSPASVTVADLNTRMMQEDLANKTKVLFRDQFQLSKNIDWANIFVEIASCSFDHVPKYCIGPLATLCSQQ